MTEIAGDDLHLTLAARRQHPAEWVELTVLADHALGEVQQRIDHYGDGDGRGGRMIRGARLGHAG